MTDVLQPENPYAAPLAKVLPQVAGTGDGIWRWKKMLVMQRDAMLPGECLKTNEPGIREMKRRISWHHPAWFLAVLTPLGLFGYFIVAVFARRTAQVSFFIGERMVGRRRRAKFGGFGLIALAALGALGPSNGILPMEWDMPLFLLACILMPVGILWLNFGSGLVRAKRITKEYVWILGVHPAVLAELPEWQFGYQSPA